MDNPDEENMAKWILINSVENAEEVTESYDIDMSTLVDSDLESDGISIISHNESSAEEEYIRCSGTYNKIDNVSPISSEDTIKWILSDSDVSLRPPSKTFFLDCLQEPIEELSEQELGTNQSDPKSDYVAIISECGSNFINENEPSLPEPKKDIIGIRNFSDNIHKYVNRIVIGSIILATISIFLGSYLDYTEEVEDELHHQERIFKNILKESSYNIDDISKKYNMMNTLYLCEQKFKSNNSSMQQNAHKCLVQIKEKIMKERDHLRKKDIEKLQKNLKIKEHYLNEREKFLIKREYKLLKAEIKFQSVKKQHNFKNKNKNHLKFANLRSFETGHDFEYEKNHVHKDLFKGNIKLRNKIHDKRRCHSKNKKDEINDSKEVLRPKQEHFYTEKDENFNINHRNKFSKNKEYQRKYDNKHKAKKTKVYNNDKAIANNERISNYKHDKAQRM